MVEIGGKVEGGVENVVVGEFEVVGGAADAETGFWGEQGGRSEAAYNCEHLNFNYKCYT